MENDDVEKPVVIPVPQNPNDDLQGLYTQKGQLTTEIEIAQARLQFVNQQISNIYNKQRGLVQR